MTGRFYITDERVHAAFDWLAENAENAAIARAMRERCADDKKAAKARAFIGATGNNAFREAEAILSQGYLDACEKEYQAIQADEYNRRQTSNCSAIIDAWRTCQSNERAMGRVG